MSLIDEMNDHNICIHGSSC